MRSNVTIDHLALDVSYEDAGDGWTVATMPAIPGVISQGKTREEAFVNLRDALLTMCGASSATDDEETSRHVLRRGDEIEAWLKRKRNRCRSDGSGYQAIDWVLRDYRERADKGLTLSPEDDHNGLLA